MEEKDFELKATGLWYVRNGELFLEVRKASNNSKFGIAMGYHKYISEKKIKIGEKLNA